MTKTVANNASASPVAIPLGEQAAPETLNLPSWYVAKASERAIEAAKAANSQSAIKAAVADYKALEASLEADKAKGEAVTAKLETAAAVVSRALADAVMVGTINRKGARQAMGEAFGFTLSDTTGKPTSKPNEPGNTIAKRVSSVTIAAEYVLTGQLPDKGGDSLPLVDFAVLQDIYNEYAGGHITVRAASERFEKAISAAKISVPLEMDAEKLRKLAGKIQSAGAAIAASDNPDLVEAYQLLVETVMSIPFAAGEGN